MADDSTPKLTHLDEAGQARMVDVSAKEPTEREARAHAVVRMQPATLRAIESGETKKGDVLATARIAGIQAAKRTSELIPLCHHLALTGCKVDFEADPDGVRLHVRSWVRCRDRTGVEMEALTAASIAALTIYDMCKAIDRGMTIEAIALVEKKGGKSGHYVRE